MADMKPVTIRGFTYGSHGAAARDLGVTTAAITLARQRGSLDRIGQGPKAASPIEIRGVTYPSSRAAAKALGLARSTIYAALESGKLDRVGLKKVERSKT